MSIERKKMSSWLIRLASLVATTYLSVLYFKKDNALDVDFLVLYSLAITFYVIYFFDGWSFEIMTRLGTRISKSSPKFVYGMVDSKRQQKKNFLVMKIVFLPLSLLTVFFLVLFMK